MEHELRKRRDFVTLIQRKFQVENHEQLRPDGAMQSWQSPHGRPLPHVGDRTLIMAILNVTPDSFSDGGHLDSLQAIVDRAGALIAAGADVLDVGGESTRPGAAAVSADEELNRVLPAIEALRRAFPQAALSVDTYKAEVAQAAVRAGADIINDVWGLSHGLTPEQREELRNETKSGGSRVQPGTRPVSPMASVAAALGCPVILMHNRPDRNYVDFWADFETDLKCSLHLAEKAGIARHQIWLDPGFGFAKTPAQNLAVIRDLGRICAWGYPVLIGTSRKSTLGLVLGTEVNRRAEGTAATAVWSVQQGCSMVRVHDVDEVVPFLKVADALKAGLRFQSA